LDAKPDQENEVADFLCGRLAIVRKESLSSMPFSTKLAARRTLRVACRLL